MKSNCGSNWTCLPANIITAGLFQRIYTRRRLRTFSCQYFSYCASLRDALSYKHMTPRHNLPIVVHLIYVSASYDMHIYFMGMHIVKCRHIRIFDFFFTNFHLPHSFSTLNLARSAQCSTLIAYSLREYLTMIIFINSTSSCEENSSILFHFPFNCCTVFHFPLVSLHFSNKLVNLPHKSVWNLKWVHWRWREMFCK